MPLPLEGSSLALHERSEPVVLSSLGLFSLLLVNVFDSIFTATRFTLRMERNTMEHCVTCHPCDFLRQLRAQLIVVWRHISVCSTQDLHRERSQHFGFLRWLGEYLCKKKKYIEEQEKYLWSCQLNGSLLETIPTTTFFHTKITSLMITRRDPVQSSQQNGGVPEKTEAERIEIEKFPNPTTSVIWKMNFQSEVYSSSSFPTESMVWIIPPRTLTNSTRQHIQWDE